MPRYRVAIHRLKFLGRKELIVIGEFEANSNREAKKKAIKLITGIKEAP